MSSDSISRIGLSRSDDRGRLSNPGGADRAFGFAAAIWGLMILSFLTVRYRAAEDLMKPGGIDLQSKMQILAWFVLGLIAIRLVRIGRADLRLLLHPPLCWYTLFALLALISSLYSISPPLTLFRSGQVVIVILLVVSMRGAFHRLYALIAIYLAANWVLVLMANTGIDFGMRWMQGPDGEFLLFGRQTAQPWRFGSPLGHPSQISIIGAAAAGGVLARFDGPHLRRRLPLFAFFVVTVLLTISRTAIAGMFLAIFLVLAVRNRIIALVLMGGVVLPLLVMVPSMGGAVVQFGMRGQSSEEFKSLTGRSEIYRQGIDRAVEALPFGEGFVAGRAKAIVSKNVGNAIVHSHNLFIESSIGMGLLGLVSASMVLLVHLICLLRAIQIPPDRSGISPGWEMVAMSIPLLGFTILDRGFAAPVAPFLCIFIAVLAATTQLLLDRQGVAFAVSARLEKEDDDGKFVPNHGLDVGP